MDIDHLVWLCKDDSAFSIHQSNSDDNWDLDNCSILFLCALSAIKTYSNTKITRIMSCSNVISRAFHNKK